MFLIGFRSVLQLAALSVVLGSQRLHEKSHAASLRVTPKDHMAKQNATDKFPAKESQPFRKFDNFLRREVKSDDSIVKAVVSEEAPELVASNHHLGQGRRKNG